MSELPDPVVTSVTSRGDSVIIDFEDGHHVVIVGYKHGFGYQVEGMRHFTLLNGDVEVVRYNGRLYRSGGADEHQFVRVADGYSLELIAAYWQTAWRHIDDEYTERPSRERRQAPSELWFPWIVTSYGCGDLNSIKEGRKPLPEATAS